LDHLVEAGVALVFRVVPQVSGNAPAYFGRAEQGLEAKGPRLSCPIGGSVQVPAH